MGRFKAKDIGVPLRIISELSIGLDLGEKAVKEPLWGMGTTMDCISGQWSQWGELGTERVCHRYLPKSPALIISMYFSVIRVTLLAIPQPLQILCFFHSMLILTSRWDWSHFIGVSWTEGFAFIKISAGKPQLFHTVGVSSYMCQWGEQKGKDLRNKLALSSKVWSAEPFWE